MTTKTSLVDLADAASAIEMELGKLPDSAQGVADHLLKLGIRGKSAGSKECPLHAYLKQRVKLGDDASLHVFMEEVMVGAGKFEIMIEMPTGVKGFVYGVTHDKYPGLIERSEPVSA